MVLLRHLEDPRAGAVALMVNLEIMVLFVVLGCIVVDRYHVSQRRAFRSPWTEQKTYMYACVYMCQQQRHKHKIEQSHRKRQRSNDTLHPIIP